MKLFKKIRRAAVCLVIAAAFIMFSCKSLTAVAAAAENPERGFICVYGSGAVTAEPDCAYLTIGVQEKARGAAEAYSSAASKIAAIAAAVENTGVDKKDLQTCGVSLYEYRDYPHETLLFTAGSRLLITVRDVTKIAAVFDAAAEAGANSGFSIEFAVSERQLLEREALKLAATDASEKAAVLAAAMGAETGAVIEITESAPVRGGIYYADAVAYKTAGAESIRTGTVKIEAGVTVKFEVN